LKTPLIQTGRLQGSESMALAQEIRLFRRIRHPNVVLFHGASVVKHGDGVHLCLVLEWCEGGDLLKHVKNRHRSGNFRADCVWAITHPRMVFQEQKILQDVARAMHYLHSQNPPILHRDLKPGNILLETSDPPKAKIADFGLSLMMKNESHHGRAGTRGFMAPEVTTGDYNSLADVFSFGCVVYYVLTAEGPNPLMAQDDVLKAAKETGFLPPVVVQVAWQCLHFDPLDRYDFNQVFQMLSFTEKQQRKTSSDADDSGYVGSDAGDARNNASPTNAKKKITGTAGTGGANRVSPQGTGTARGIGTTASGGKATVGRTDESPVDESSPEAEESLAETPHVSHDSPGTPSRIPRRRSDAAQVIQNDLEAQCLAMDPIDDEDSVVHSGLGSWDHDVQGEHHIADSGCKVWIL